MQEPIYRASNNVPELDSGTEGAVLMESVTNTRLGHGAQFKANTDFGSSVGLIAQLSTLHKEREEAPQLRDDTERHVNMPENRAQEATRDAVIAARKSLLGKFGGAILLQEALTAAALATGTGSDVRAQEEQTSSLTRFLGRRSR